MDSLNPQERFELENLLWHTTKGKWCTVEDVRESLGEGDYRSTIDPTCYAKRISTQLNETVHPITLHLDAH
ncbi:MAG: hypothetical protein HN348_34645 [Proteobacteria bacterium]|nr:hypothetical protein [Pseudomonadota bacterium]